MSRLCFITLFGWLPLLLVAQANDVRFEATTNAEQVTPDTYFDVTFTLFNADGSNLELPADLTQNFTVVAGPSRSSRTTIINGQRSSALGFSFSLQAKRTGTFTIGPARIEVDGQTYRTDPLQIEVVEAEAIEEAAATTVFLTAEPDTTAAYVGQQLVVDYVLYTQQQVEGINVVSEAEYEGFFRRYPRVGGRSARMVVRNGRQYLRQVLRRVALYPQRSGTFEIEPLRLTLGLPDPSRPSGGFFFNRNVRRVPVASEPLTLRVASLPEPLPADFSGAVGRFSMEAEISRRRATTDDALSLRLTIRGTGDINRIQVPALNLPASVEIYDAKLLDEGWDDTASPPRGYRVYEYPLIFTEAGDFVFTPELVYFDPQENAYARASAQAIALSIGAGSGRPATGLPTVAADEENALAPAAERVPLRRLAPPPLWRQWWFWLLAGLPLLVLAGQWAYQRRQAHLAGIDPATRRRQAAQRIADQRLRTARDYQDAGDQRAFYDELIRALQGFLTDKLGIPRSELSKANAQARLAAAGVTPATVTAYIELLRDTDRALYGGSGGDMAQHYEQAQRVILDVSEQVK
jgi:hypothetical protein